MKKKFPLLSLLCFLVAFAAAAQQPRERMIAAARDQVGRTVSYDGSYRRIAYPGGDVPLHTGVCTDVVIRAFRKVGIDLQVLVHEDMSRDFSAYPKNWGLRRPDRNIDHRRVPNLGTFFRRSGKAVRGEFLPGDIVTWRLPSGVPHIGIVTGGRSVVHNIGYGAKEEDVLHAWTITGHYRWF
jgi:uncharacterized protein YijF (DUF1287 family)